MQDDEGIGLRQLERIGLVCSKCGAESTFEIKAGSNLNADQKCPGCDDPDFIPIFKPLRNEQLSIVDAIRHMIPISTQSEVRLYFGPCPPE
jgi:DNA replicative helicase MCM subunit Mcm2 (Cdc46/Mcm family)